VTVDSSPESNAVPAKAPPLYWALLVVAIVAEVIATTMLKSTEGFTRLWPSVIVITCYETAFILLALCVKRIAVSVVYALWSGVGVALVTLVAWFWMDQKLDAVGMLGVALIIAGVVVLNGWSKTTAA
jgi:small multidrug resistance pump